MSFDFGCKSYCLGSVSHGALRVGYALALRRMRAGDASAEVTGKADVFAGVGAVLVGFEMWLRVWLAWVLHKNIAPARLPRNSQLSNRQCRRLQSRIDRSTFSSVRQLWTFQLLLPRGLSATQYLERMSRISLLGRVKLYRINYFGTVLVRRAVLVCYDHGWWRAPIGAFGRVSGGIWRAHIWPAWR